MLSSATSLIEKVRKTVRGSADDIGWLQKAPDVPPVEDGTQRFTEILDEIRYTLFEHFTSSYPIRYSIRSRTKL